MVCIYCQNETQVINSRHQKRSNQVWRRRQCDSCQNIFTTIETPDFASSVLFRGTSNHLEPFSRDKLFVSIYNSLKHRKDALTDATALTNTVMAKVSSGISNATVERDKLIEVVAQVLKRFDKTANVVYLAYHPL